MMPVLVVFHCIQVNGALTIVDKLVQHRSTIFHVTHVALFQHSSNNDSTLLC